MTFGCHPRFTVNICARRHNSAVQKGEGVHTIHKKMLTVSNDSICDLYTANTGETDFPCCVGFYVTQSIFSVRKLYIDSLMLIIMVHIICYTTLFCTKQLLLALHSFW